MGTTDSVFSLKLPARVHFGRGQLTRMQEICQRRGWRRVGIVTDQAVRDAGLLDRLRQALPREAEVRVFDRVQPEPPVSCVTEAVSALSGAARIDGVIGLGGGSVMDVAKVAAVVLATGAEVPSLFGIDRVGRRGLATVMIPTTAGTGSEATGVAILTREDSGLKVGVADPAIVPDEAIVDPSLTDGLPPEPTAAAGIDALVHAVEAYLANIATPLARGLAPRAVAAIAPALEPAVRDGANRLARDGLALGAHLAGMAFANSSCCAVHALALPLGGRYHVPHGVATGGLVAATMRHNLPACEDAFRELAAAMGWPNQTPDAFVEELAALADRLGITRRLRDYDVPADALPQLAAEAVATRRLMDPNPRPITETEAVAIYRAALGHP